MFRKWIEPITLTLIVGVVFFLPVFNSRLPVFYGQFNNLDGSLYAVRAVDLILSVALILIVSRRLIPARMDLRDLGLSLLGMATLFLGASILEWAWDALVLRAFNLPIGPGEISDKMLAFPNRENLNLTVLPGNLLMLAIGIVYGLVLDRGRQVRQRERLERENLAAEVKYLRSQINPHFLFNTLNNIYAITQRNEDADGGDALLRLSDLMRYMLYDSAGGSVSLSREIEHLRNYMDLMLLKYKAEDPPEIKLDVEGEAETCQVAPLLLLPFVENAFKHGINSKGQGRIQISISITGESLLFKITNSRFQDRQASDEHKGIGLENVRRRLEHLYPGQHRLELAETGNEYSAKLRIDL